MFKIVKNIVFFAFVFGVFFFGLAKNSYAGPGTGCPDSDQGCGANGCSATKRRVCSCTYCDMSGNNDSCLSWSCGCQNDSSCQPACSPSCGSNNCGDDGCGGSCGSCASGVCNAGTCCVNAAPAAPVIASPANATQVRVGVATILDWNATTSWGTACTTPANSYQVCISSTQVSCDLANWTNAGAATQLSWTPSVADTYVTWQPRANNGNSSTASAPRSLCVEGFNSASPTYVSAWSTCNSSFTRTRTCREDCGTDDCTAFQASGNALSQSCQGSIRGTIFDASNRASCPAFNPATGFLTGLNADEIPPVTTFAISDQSAIAPHPYTVLTQPTTNSSGNYTALVYAPATYGYDFTGFRSYFILSGGPKLTCTSTAAVVPDNPTTCTTQPCSIVNNISFGFNRLYGGWWRASGAGVYADTGIKSVIPPTATDQNLMTPNTAEGNRIGFLTYGVTKPTDLLGANPSAKISTSALERQSKYAGLIYDWGYYNNRFNLFKINPWNGTDPIVYSDPNSLGYQIYKVDSGINSFTYNPSAGEKVIVLAHGDVNVTSNIVVPNTAFLVIIASGSIIFDSSVTRADGWYVASTISTPCHSTTALGCDQDDSQFVGNGSFVAWNGFNLARHQGVLNNTQPSAQFNYRQDLFTNAPKPMKLFTKIYKPFIP